jgi:hypothetical protein
VREEVYKIKRETKRESEKVREEVYERKRETKRE